MMDLLDDVNKLHRHELDDADVEVQPLRQSLLQEYATNFAQSVLSVLPAEDALYARGRLLAELVRRVWIQTNAEHAKQGDHRDLLLKHLADDWERKFILLPKLFEVWRHTDIVHLRSKLLFGNRRSL
jgi:hypothetical protein